MMRSSRLWQPRIEAVRADRRFYGYRESSTLAHELDRIREGITRELLPFHPRAAAVSDCGRAWAAVAERDPKMLAVEVLDLFTTDEYGARRRGDHRIRGGARPRRPR